MDMYKWNKVKIRNNIMAGLWLSPRLASRSDEKP
jgi:hypothetical protein